MMETVQHKVHYCHKCGKVLIEKIVTIDPPYYDFNTGKKMQMFYYWYDCPDYMAHKVKNIEHTHDIDIPIGVKEV